MKNNVYFANVINTDRMKPLLYSLIFFFSLVYKNYSFAQESKWLPTTLINKVEFYDTSFNNDNAGCGFLLKFDNDTFAITAKHVLMVAKTDSMKTTNIEGYIKKWTMFPKDKRNQTIVMDSLLNPDITDSLTWNYLIQNRFNYQDWLVFSIKENKSNVVPLEIRRTELLKGEKLYAIGWTYQDKEGSQKIYKYSYINEIGTHFNMKIITAPVNSTGLSGSPVVDSNGLLVGIISDSYFDTEKSEKYSTPCSVKGLIQILNNIEKE